MPNSPTATEFISQALFRFNESYPRIEKCLNKLTEEEVWKRPNNNSNSIGNLMLHLCGNITQYIMHGLDGQPDIRERDREFEARRGYSKTALLDKLKSVTDTAATIIGSATEDNLNRPRIVQGFDLTGTGIILHVVEHFSYHTGQITFWTKMLKDVDLGYYADLDLNV
ncbi:MAG: DinB family protein [Bacteroidota bacterium]